MKIGIVIMTDDGERCAMARDTFDEKKGYHWDDLHKLYQRCRSELSIKIKKAEEVKHERTN